VDKRRPGIDELEVFVSPEGAQAGAADHQSSALVEVIGPAVLILDPSLAPFRSDYVARVTRLVDRAKA
jgi:hypothetical protein